MRSQTAPRHSTPPPSKSWPPDCAAPPRPAAISPPPAPPAKSSPLPALEPTPPRPSRQSQPQPTLPPRSISKFPSLRLRPLKRRLLQKNPRIHPSRFFHSLLTIHYSLSPGVPFLLCVLCALCVNSFLLRVPLPCMLRHIPLLTIHCSLSLPQPH